MFKTDFKTPQINKQSRSKPECFYLESVSEKCISKFMEWTSGIC